VSLESLLAADTVTVQRPTNTKDAAAGRVTTWAAVYSNVPARVEDTNSHQRLAFAQTGLIVSHVVYTRQEGIQNGDRVIDSLGRVLRVVGFQFFRALGTIPSHWMILCEQVSL
jgi:head-tail adaptor